MLQANPQLDHFDVKEILTLSAVDFGEPGWDNQFGAGRLNSYDAVVLATVWPEVPAASAAGALVLGLLVLAASVPFLRRHG